jgi:hypothetical protein
LGVGERLSKALAGFRGSTAVAPMTTAGTSSSEMYGGYGYVVNVDERVPGLTGKQRWRTYRKLVLDTVIVGASVRYFLNLLADAEWTVQPPTDEDGEPLPGAQDVADFVEDVMFNMETPWSRIIRRAAMYRFLGFSIQEWTAVKRDDGRIGMKDVESRPQSTIERWDLDPGGSVLGVTQNATGRKEVYLPRGKIVYLVDDALEETPQGTGLFRHLVKPSERLRAYEELEQLAFETDLRGIPIGWAPLKELRTAVENKSMTLDMVRKARSAVDNFVRNKLLNKSKGAVFDSETYQGLTADGGTTPSGTKKWGVELLRGDSSHIDEANQAVQRINTEMARLLGTEHLLLGSDGTGSLALSTSKLSSFFLIATSTNGEIAEAFDRDFVGVVCSLNGIPKELWPTLRPQEIDVNDIEAVATALQSLATAGAPLQPDDPAVDLIRARMGLPPAPPPPEMSDEEMALIDRARTTGVDPNKIDVNPPQPAPANTPGSKPVASGSEGAAAQRIVTKLMKALLEPNGPKPKPNPNRRKR